MFDVPAIDITAISNNSQTQAAANVATPFARREPPRSIQGTHTVTLANPFGPNVYSHTLTVAEAREERAKTAPKTTAQGNTSDLDRRMRVALVVKRHEAKPTREDDARLDILTQRIRRLDPRVTPQQLDKLGSMIDDLEFVSAGLDSIRDRYSLRK